MGEGGHVLVLGVGTNLKINYNNGTKIQPTQANQHNSSGNQETMPICSLTFQVTTKLLMVTIRPLTPPSQVELNRSSCFQLVISKRK